MSGANVNYNAVLADLEIRKEELESAITAIKNIIAAGGGVANGSFDGGVYNPENIPIGAFLRLSIPEATKKFLDMVKSKQNIPTIIRALERGGIPPIKYQTIYAVLRRRESEVGDIIRLDDDWALAEWYPNNPNLRKRTPEKKATGKATKGKPQKKTTAVKKAKTKEKKPAQVTSITSVPRQVPPPPVATPPAAPKKLKATDAAELVLIRANGALALSTIVEQVNSDFGQKMTVGFLKGMLGNAKTRFKSAGNDTWDLVNRPKK